MTSWLKTTRRGFLSQAATAVAAPYVLTSTALGAADKPAASERLTIGHIGTGGRGSHLMGNFLQVDACQSVAVADVDRGHGERAKNTIEKKYAQAKRDGKYEGCEVYGDFRKLVARDDIDVVVIATPDHWHGLISVAAAKSGKDIYCEKPATRTIAEGRAVCEAVKKYGRIFQTGSHERSNRNSRYACELVRNGRIGKLHTVEVSLPVDHGHCPMPKEPSPVPDGFDYDFWLGPAPMAPYYPQRCHFSFRYIRDYAMGEFSDRGAHVLDIGHWGMGCDDTGSVEISGTGEAPKVELYNTFRTFKAELKYANGVKLMVESKAPRGVKFIGDKGWINVAIHGAHLSASDPELLKSKIGPDEIHLHESPGSHRDDFLKAVATRGETVCPAEVGHRTNSALCLCEIAILRGRPLKWDPKAEKFLNDAEADRMIGRTMRAPWRL